MSAGDTGFSDLNEMQASGRRGLLARLFGMGQQANAPLSGDYGAPGSWSDPAVLAQRNSGRLRDRVADDTTRSPGTFEETAPEEAQSLRGSLAQQVRGMNQTDGPSRMDQMQAEYDQLGQPAARPSLKQILLRSLASGVQQGYSPRGLTPEENQRRIQFDQSQAQQGQEFDTQQRNAQRNSLRQEMEAERRMQEQEQLATDRMTLQERMQTERERAAQEAQGRLFSQQNQLEASREQARQQAATQAQQASEERQSRQFAEGEKMQDKRLAAQMAMEDKRLKASEGRKDIGTREKVLTYWQPTLDSAERVNVMSKNLEDGMKGDQQAMLSLLSNHLGMTMGLQKGARLNQAIIEEAQKARPWLQGMRAKFDQDGYLTGVVLTPQQMRQMVDLGFERYREDVKKSRSMAGYVGETDEPQRQLSREAARQYLEKAGGDKNRARQMAQQDGWNF